MTSQLPKQSPVRQSNFVAVYLTEKEAISDSPTPYTILLLIPSDDGTVEGIPSYHVWSALLRSYKRYKPQTAATLELRGSPPLYANYLLDLVDDPRAIPRRIVDFLDKVDAVSEEQLSTYVAAEKEKQKQDGTHVAISSQMDMSYFERAKLSGRERRLVHTALVRGILITTPYHCLQSQELIAEIVDYLIKSDEQVMVDNLNSRTVADIHDDVLPQFHVTKGKVSKHGVDGLMHGTVGRSRAMKALNHAKMMYIHYIPKGEPVPEEDKESAITARLEEIKYHVEGGVIETQPWKKWAARMYVVITLIVSVLSGALNWAGRDNYYERISDIVQSLTVLWVSVFGLIKLTSEDENAIRNTLLGKNILRSSRDVMKYAKCEDDQMLKRGMIRASRLEWLDSAECSYLTATASGSIRVLGGISIIDCLRNGMLLLGDRVFYNEDSGAGYIFRVSEDGNHSVKRDNLGRMQSNYQVVTETGLVT